MLCACEPPVNLSAQVVSFWNGLKCHRAEAGLFDPKTSLETRVGLFDPVNEQACCAPGGSPCPTKIQLIHCTWLH